MYCCPILCILIFDINFSSGKQIVVNNIILLGLFLKLKEYFFSQVKRVILFFGKNITFFFFEGVKRVIFELKIRVPNKYPK